MTARSIYDSDSKERELGQQLDSPEWYDSTLKDIQNLPETDEPATKSDTPEDIENQENSTTPDAGQDVPAADKEQQNYSRSNPMEDEGPAQKKGKGALSRLRGLRLTRRRAIIGGAGGLLVGGSVGLFSIISGPLQMVNLSQILQKQGWHSEQTTSKRFATNFRYLRTGQVGETRLDVLGSRIHANTVRELERVGITYESSRRTGQVASISIDPSRSNNFRAGANSIETRNNIANKLGIPANLVTEADGRFRVDTTHMGAKQLKNISETTLSNLADGSVISGLRYRKLARFHNINSMFHPWRRASASIERGIDNSLRATRSRILDSERERAESRRRSSIRDAAVSARERINDRMGGTKRVIGAALFAADTLCLIRTISDAIPVVNYGYVVAPAVVESADIISSGSQIMAGEDFTFDQVGNRLESLKDDEGRTVFENKAINALSTGTDGRGEDLDNDLRQAFSPANTRDSIESSLGVGSGGVLDAIGDATCSGPGLALQFIAGIGLTALSGGTWTVGKASVAVGQAALTSGAVAFLADKAVDYFAQDPVEFIQGPIGGGLLAYGARAGFNSSARGDGGVELTQTEERIAYAEYQKYQREEFRSKSFAQRILNPFYSDSVLSIAMRGGSYDLEDSFSKVASYTTNPTKIVSATFNNLDTKTYAATTYDWGFPLYGTPSDLLDNPEFEDYNENARLAANVLNGPRASEMVQKAMDCFGAELRTGIEGWQVVSKEDVNPALPEYYERDCDNYNTDRDWARVIVFIFDYGIMVNQDCLNGSADSCTDVGLNPDVAINAPSSTPAQNQVINSGPVSGIRTDATSTTLPNCPYSGPPGGTRGDQPGTTQVYNYLVTTYQLGRGGIFSCRAVINGTNSGRPSPHSEGRAGDLMVNFLDPVDKVRGDQAYAWLINNAVSLGLQNAKWGDQTWSPTRGLRPNTNADDVRIHSNHIHFELNWDGALARTSYFSAGGTP